jgi:hypothetical protein
MYVGNGTHSNSPGAIDREPLVRRRGRTSNVAFWTGQYFVTAGNEGDEDVAKIEPYYAADAGCFQPFCLIDEGENVEPIGAGHGWDRHYSRKLRFK